MDEELRCYDEYMDHARGLAPKSRSMALRIIGRLLTARFGSGVIDIAAIKPEQVRRFFAQEAVRYSKPASLASVVASLRGYFRYHASLGDRVHGGLIGAITGAVKVVAAKSSMLKRLVFLVDSDLLVFAG
ncbi:Phage-related integrase [Polaromonas sp. CG9_12]|nr:Phage-related integrase [Polaromonas sp. CG9_12]